MKYSLIVLFSVLLFTAANFAQSTYFIKYKDSVSEENISAKISGRQILPSIESFSVTNDQINARFFGNGIARGEDIIGKLVTITVPQSLTADDLLTIESYDADIEYIQPSNLYQVNYIPNDSLIADQWALSKIEAYDAWDITGGADSIIIGVIDTGIDYLHPDLANKLFINQGEMGPDGAGGDKMNNGIDDDGNGFIDDYRGWDFTDRVGFPFDSTGGDYLFWDNDPMDENGFSHGTSVAGIIGAETNNGIGIAGAAPNVTILNLRAFDPTGYGEEEDVAAAIIYAVNMGAKVINMSFGDYSFSYVLRDVIRYAYARGVVLVASAGNSNSSDPHYPSGYSEVISVGNSTENDFVAGSSNYGSTIDLVAPGTGIWTTVRNYDYQEFNGTSAAAPFVAAAAGLVLSQGNFTNEEVKQIIKSTTDDIGSAGWDERSGAGRLNINKALSVLSPSIVSFITPYQDFATSDSTMPIVATAISPYFLEFDLYVGEGLNPETWTSLISAGKNQFLRDTLVMLDVTAYKDTAYTMRLVLKQTNGRTMEERVNFHIIRSAPEAEVISVFPAFYGDKTTILASLFTYEPAVVRMFYREAGAQDFNFVSLDGFATNNQFVKQLHYGFIPPNIVHPNTRYEIYFEVENLVGLTTTVKDSLVNFAITTDMFFNLIPATKMPFTLPAGYLFGKTTGFVGQEGTGVIVRDLINAKTSHHYVYENEQFTKITTDSLYEKIAKDYGDFNNNGKADLLTLWAYTTQISEQNAPGSFTLIEETALDSANFWPIMIDDIDMDGTNEALIITGDTEITVYAVNADLSLTKETSFNNYSPAKFGGNYLDSPNLLVVDSDNDGKNEIWLVDSDGDIMTFDVEGSGQIQQGFLIETGYYSSSAFISAGDFNGDNILDIAILLQSVEEIDVAPFNLLYVFNVVNGSLQVIFDQAFIDPTSEFSSQFQRASNSLKFVDVDNDFLEELVLFTYPYSYIFNYEYTGIDVLHYEENVNSTEILVSDFNGNGSVEIAFPKNEGISFYEFGMPNKPFTPVDVKGYSLDSASVRIEWNSNDFQFYVYKGETENQLVLYDSSQAPFYVDGNVELMKDYYYGIQSYNPAMPEHFSEISKPAIVYHHAPARIQNVESRSVRSVFVTFSGRVNKTIESLLAFQIYSDSLNTGGGDLVYLYPSSIVPAGEQSYLVTFKEDIPFGENLFIINDLRDFYGSPVPNELFAFVHNPVFEAQEFFIDSYEILSSDGIKLTFNLEVDPATAGDVSNYILTPDNTVIGAAVSNESAKTVIIRLDGKKPIGSIGIEYKLSVKNLLSSAATGSIPINTGAGSEVVLSSFADDISDVYVYPNPVKLSNGAETLTFANLPQYARIVIFSLTGDHIKTLKEVDGNGGLAWDMKDENGERISSGIYVYRVEMLTENGDEVENTLGKFAVVR